MGKTAVALNLASNAARMANVSVAIFSLEMPTNQLITRMLACEAEVNSKHMQTGFLDNQQIERLIAGVRSMIGPFMWMIHRVLRLWRYGRNVGELPPIKVCPHWGSFLLIICS